MIRGKMAIMIDPRKMMPGNQPQDIQSIIRAKKQQDNGEEPEGDAGISGPIIDSPTNASVHNSPSNEEASEAKSSEANDGGNEEGETSPAAGGLKHIKRAKVTGRKSKKIPIFTQDASEKRAMVINEIRRSEQLYVMVIESFISVFVRPLLADPANYKLTSGQASQLCSQIKEVSTYATKFYNSPAFASGSEIADAFIESIDDLTNVYNSYVEKFTSNVLQNFHILRTNVRFSAFLRQVQERHSIQVIDSFLIPLQRMAVYELLLRKLMQNYPEGSPEADKINRAIGLIRASSEACSSIREEAEESAKVLSEQLALARNGRDIALWSPERRLIRKATLIKGKRSVREKPESSQSMDTRGENHRMVMLFTDLLLWATEMPEGAYKGHLFLSEAAFRPLNEGDVPSIIVSVLSEDEKNFEKAKALARAQSSEAGEVRQSTADSRPSEADGSKKYTKGDGWLLTFSDMKDRDSWLQEILKLKSALDLLPEDSTLTMPLNVRSDKAKSCCTVM